MRLEFQRSSRGWVVGTAALLLGVATHGDARGQPVATTRASVGSGGIQANGDSTEPSISADGLRACFTSLASNLVAGDSNGTYDIFLRDSTAGLTTRISVANDGSQATGPSVSCRISADGRLVAFGSLAGNLVPGDTNGDDVFVRDLDAGTTTRVSVADDGSQAQGDSSFPALSGDGRFVAFSSNAENLVAGDDNGFRDVFVRDRLVPGTTRVSVATGGTQANDDSWESAISGDGRYVAFASGAANLVSGDTNGQPDIFVHDLQTGQTSRVSVSSLGAQGNGDCYSPAISGDGRYVAFSSYSSNLVPDDLNGVADVFVKDLVTGGTVRVSVSTAGTESNADSFEPSISADGGSVAFKSFASNLVPGDDNGEADIFVRDMVAGTTARLSVGTGGTSPDGGSDTPAMAGSGVAVAFVSSATNLVPGDTNFAQDVFVARAALFADGFESGDASAWSQVTP